MKPKTDIDIIMTVENYPILWNIRSKDYKNKVKQELTWNLVADILEMNVQDVQYMWKSIRRKFVRLSNKPKKSGSSLDELEKWHLYKYLTFLIPVVSHRRTYTNAPQQIEESSLIEGGDAVQHNSNTSPQFTQNYPSCSINTEELLSDLGDDDDEEDDDMDTILMQNETSTTTRNTSRLQTPTILCLNPKKNIQHTQPQNTFQQKISAISQTHKSIIPQTFPEVPFTDITNHSNTTTPSPNLTIKDTPTHYDKKKIDKKIIQYMENTEQYLLNKVKNDTDEDLCFFKGTLSVLKSFSPETKLQFKNEYMEMLLRYKQAQF